MKMKTGAIVLGLLLAGCGGGMDQETAAEAEDKDAAVEPMSEPMEKAEAVEDQAMEHKDDIDDAVQDAEEAVDETVDEVAEDSGQ